MKADVAIIDLGIGNLMSIEQAFLHAACNCSITRDHKVLTVADAVVLPGVGAFGDAMKLLKKYDLEALLKDIADSNTFLIGICLGMQLLFTESSEFGISKGLDLIDGSVDKLPVKKDDDRYLYKVPQIGWNQVKVPGAGKYSSGWENTPMRNINQNEAMYFMHSFYVKPRDADVVLTQTDYADLTYCSSIYKDNIIAFQFHPERSGREGLKIYSNLAKLIQAQSA